MGSAELLDLRIPEKVVRVVTYAFENAVEAFLEPSIRILSTMMRRASQRRGDAALRDELLLLLLQNFGALVELVLGDDEATGEQVLECVTLAMDLSGNGRIAAEVVNADALAHLASSLRPANCGRTLALLVKACSALSGPPFAGADVDVAALSCSCGAVKKALEDVRGGAARADKSERALAAELLSELLACSR